MILRIAEILAEWQKNSRYIWVILPMFFSCYGLYAQSAFATVDSTQVTVGQRITYKIFIELNQILPVEFPNNKAFKDLVVIDSTAVDTLKESELYKLVKTYKLLGLDEKIKQIPSQNLKIAGKIMQIDSIPIEIKSIAVDTKSEEYYDTKPMEEVERVSTFNGTIIVYIIIVTLIILGAYLLYRFREKLFPKKEKIEHLPPYERLKKRLQVISQSDYLDKINYKAYYSQLVHALRLYIEEEISVSVLETTSDEFIFKMKSYAEKNNIQLKQSFWDDLKQVLLRSDMVKFAKSLPERHVVENDFNTVEQFIFQINYTMPAYILEEREARAIDIKALKEKQRKRNIKYIFYVLLGLGVITMGIFVASNGVRKTFDTLTANPTLKLLNRDWVKSTYGFPPIEIETPDFLRRVEADSTAHNKSGAKENSHFQLGGVDQKFLISLDQIKIPSSIEDQKLLKMLETFVDNKLKTFGGQNIIHKQDEFITLGGSEGVKDYGNFDYPLSGTSIGLNYTIVSFFSESKLSQLTIIYEVGDSYSPEIEQRILNSLAFKKLEP